MIVRKKIFGIIYLINRGDVLGMTLNSNLHKAKAVKNDEFYTQISDIENELKHYEKYFKDKHIFCNCDDPELSNFWRYFALNFKRLGIKRLTSTHYSEECPQTYRMDMFKEVPQSYNDRETFMTLEETGIELPLGYITPLNSNGDFRNEESIEILKECDIVVTNPPFSLFREYVNQLIKYNKSFIIIGNKTAITYKEIYTLLKENKIWVGMTPMSRDMYFDVSDSYAEFLIENKKEGSGYKRINGVIKARASAIWFTNLKHKKRYEKLTLVAKYKNNEEDFPFYDNYDAIDVKKVVHIPYDYNGIMGVPITFLDKYNPDQFEIIKFRKGNDEKDLRIGEKNPFFRILIKKKEE